MVKKFLEFVFLFFKGALGSPTENVEYEEKVLNDLFLTIVFSERLGIPNPFYYYLVELLPYLMEELEGWEVRMSNRKSVLSVILREFGEP